MIKKIENITDALSFFEMGAFKHGEATEKGSYKEANKNYKVIIKAINYLKEHNSIAELIPFMEHSSTGVRIWASTFLLPFNEKEAIQGLKKIVASGGIHSFTAETTISEWKKGNLKL